MPCRPSVFLRLLVCLFAGWGLFPGTAWGADLTVTSMADSGAGSLRAAIATANAGDTIRFAADLKGIIDLATPLVLDKSLTILGPGARSVILSGRSGWSANPVTLPTGGHRILDITPAATTVTLEGLRFRDGFASGSWKLGTTIALSNAPDIVENGAAIRILGPGIVTIRACWFDRNFVATEPPPTGTTQLLVGGAIFLHQGTLDVETSTFNDNYAGAGSAICNYDGVANLTNCTLSGNVAYAGGAFLHRPAGRTSKLVHCTLADNVSMNTHDSGGLSVVDGSIQIQNCLVARNSLGRNQTDATRYGDLDRGWVYTADPTWGTFGTNGTITSLDGNLLGTRQDVLFTESGKDSVGTTVAPLDAKLGSLDTTFTFGGPTPVQPLLLNSPALDQNGTRVQEKDQRGYTRDAKVDAGAFERQTYLLSGSTGIPGVTLTPSDTDDPSKTLDAQISGADGAYTLRVQEGWTGRLTPAKAGYTFAPAFRAYANQGADDPGKDFAPNLLPPGALSLSGVSAGGFTVTWPSSTAATGYRVDVATSSDFTSGMAISDLPVTGLGTTISSLQPNLRFYVRVRATDGMIFSAYTTPVSTFTSKLAPAVEASAVSALATYGARLNGTVNPQNDATTVWFEYGLDTNYGASTAPNDRNGYGALAVSADLTGLAANKTYHYRMSARNSGGTTQGPDQTFTTLPAYALSGNAGTAGAALSYQDNGPKTTTADATGAYSFTVPCGWSGTVTPSKVGYTFSAAKSYTNVLADQSAQDYTATAITYLISGNAGLGGATLSYQDNGAKTATADATGAYSLAVPYGWSGTVTPSKVGYTFAAPNRIYTNVLANQSTQDYTVSLNAPGSPLATALESSGFTIGWTSSPAATEYLLDVSTQDTFGTYVGSYHDLSVTGLSSAVTGLSPATAYYVRVRARNATHTSGYAVSSAVMTAKAAPVVATGAATDLGTSTATLNGTVNAQNDTATIRFEYGPNLGYGTSLAASPASATGMADTSVSAVLSGLAPGTLHHFRVVAVNGGGTSHGTDLTFLTRPAAPTATAATAHTLTGFTAQWGAVTGATRYTLSVATTSGFGDMVAGYPKDMGTGTSEPLSGLKAGTTYYYRVTASNASGESAPSNVIAVFVGLAIPVATSATGVTTTSFIGNWNAAAGATGYRLDVATDAAFTATLAAFKDLDVGTATSCPVTGLQPNTPYFLRVRAVNATNTSANSNAITLTTSAAPPVAATQAASQVTTTTALLQGLVDGAHSATTVAFHFGLDRDHLSVVNASPSGLTGIAQVSAPLVGLEPARVYYFLVAATNSAGTTLGEVLTFTTLSNPLIPTGMSLASGAVGTPITLTGSGFNAVTSVTFGGMEALFTVVSDSEITCMVPPGAQSGPIRISTPNESVLSKTSFTVIAEG